MRDVKELIIRLWKVRLSILQIAGILDEDKAKVQETVREYMRELLKSYNDVGIADILGITKARVGQIRRKLKLPKSKVPIAAPREGTRRRLIAERNAKILKEYRSSEMASREKVKKLAEKYRVKPGMVRKILRDDGIVLKRSTFPAQNKEELEALLEKYGNMRTIAKSLGYSQPYISILARKYGIEWWKRSTFRFQNKAHFKELYKDYASFRGMARGLGVSFSYVCKKAKEFGIKAKKRRAGEVRKASDS